MNADYTFISKSLHTSLSLLACFISKDNIQASCETYTVRALLL